MKYDRQRMMLKAQWGKRLPLKVPRDSTHKDILQKGLTKWKVHNRQAIEEHEEYMLLYEDGNEAVFMPGQIRKFFMLSKY